MYIIKNGNYLFKKLSFLNRDSMKSRFAVKKMILTGKNKSREKYYYYNIFTVKRFSSL